MEVLYVIALCVMIRIVTRSFDVLFEGKCPYVSKSK